MVGVKQQSPLMLPQQQLHVLQQQQYGNQQQQMALGHCQDGGASPVGGATGGLSHAQQLQMQQQHSSSLPRS